MSGVFKNCLRSFRYQRTRFLLTVFGVAIGVLSVVLITAIGDVGRTLIENELSSMGIGGLTVGIDKTVSTRELKGSQVQVVLDDPDVQGAMPVMLQMAAARAHGMSTKCVAIGADRNAARFASLQLLHGRMLTGTGNGCVVDESFAQMMYHRSNIVGKQVEVDLGGSPIQFTVCGVVASGGNLMQGLMGEMVPTFVYLPFTTVQQAVGAGGCDQLLVRLKEGADAEQAAERIQRAVNETWREPAATVQNLASQKENLDGIFRVVTAILSLVAGISLVVAGLSIMTVMLIAVHERTREIGIKKAIGATSLRILLEFLIESGWICLIGAVAGELLGVTVAAAGCALLGLPYTPNFGVMVFCMLYAVLSGILFGVYPARRAAALPPAAALASQ